MSLRWHWAALSQAGRSPTTGGRIIQLCGTHPVVFACKSADHVEYYDMAKYQENRQKMAISNKLNFMSVIWRNRIALSIPDLYPPWVMFTIIIKTRALVVEPCREGIMIANILYLWLLPEEDRKYEQTHLDCMPLIVCTSITQSLHPKFQFINKFTWTNNKEDSILLELDVMLVRLEDKDTKDRAAVWSERRVTSGCQSCGRNWKTGGMIGRRAHFSKHLCLGF